MTQNTDCLWYLEQPLGLLIVGPRPVGVGGEVVVTLLLDPGQGLPGRSLEQAELLGLQNKVDWFDSLSSFLFLLLSL